MARSRLGAALLLPPPLAGEVDGLRRALGDRSLDRVPAHLTLVSPVNVRDSDLATALAVMRAAAELSPPLLTLEVGPPATFLPANPVLYLAVAGDLDAVAALRGRLLRPPLARDVTWPFVPHVTLADGAEPAGLAGAVAALGQYRGTAVVDRVHLLHEIHEGGSRRWVVLADAVLGPAAIVGRGGLALELTRSGRLDPEAASLVRSADGSIVRQAEVTLVRPADGSIVRPPDGSIVRPPDGSLAGPADGTGVHAALGCRVEGEGRAGLVVTARRQGAVVGAGVAWLGPDGGRVTVVVDARHRRQGIGSHVLAAVEHWVQSSGWGCTRLGAIGPAPFYRARSRFSVPVGDPVTRSGSTNSG